MVFCRVAAIWTGLRRTLELEPPLEFRTRHSDEEVIKALLCSLHYLITRNMGKNLSYEPCWDEVVLTARFYLDTGKA